jgi:hypothetical protein
LLLDNRLSQVFDLYFGGIRFESRATQLLSIDISSTFKFRSRLRIFSFCLVQYDSYTDHQRKTGLYIVYPGTINRRILHNFPNAQDDKNGNMGRKTATTVMIFIEKTISTGDHDEVPCSG